MTTVAGIDLCQDQTDGRLNLNFSYDNFSSPNQHKFEGITPAIKPHSDSPKYPHFNSLPVRLSTFHQWPHQSPGPLQLARAGLYYLGKKDQTVCYYCGGGLSSWAPEDDPDNEHVRWYPHCELVKRRKQQYATSSTKPTSVSKKDQDLEDPMKSVAVQSLMEFGYTLEHIKMAVDRLIIQKGKSVFRAVELMEIIDNCGDNQKSKTDFSNAAMSNEFEKRNETESCTDSSLSSSLISSEQSLSQLKYEQVEDNKKLDAKALKEENQRLRDMSICKICMDNASCIVFLPCGHMVCCANCSPAMRKCPICRVLVRGTVKAFME
ncbi:hypothetical protein CHS0354_018898 [Potamilus streckersoni]|uniref:RING-type domain-containing protein n=1 Tax=Potamilus streckersoni TaxID=2493646 RepID=A0AAE0VU26_9BIVA|nr:hypothetical protein CHS0354_018898 [Potamilus streckersoni]